jgi:hypothetical protein
MNVVIKETDFSNVIGTSYHNDTINASVNELIKILNINPIIDFNDKTKFQWNLEYYSEILNKRFYFTIYDYKENWEHHIGCSPGVNDYLYTTKIDWHIGGKSGDDTILVKVWLKNKLNNKTNEG